MMPFQNKKKLRVKTCCTWLFPLRNSFLTLKLEYTALLADVDMLFMWAINLSSITIWCSFCGVHLTDPLVEYVWDRNYPMVHSYTHTSRRKEGSSLVRYEFQTWYSNVRAIKRGTVHLSIKTSCSNAIVVQRKVRSMFAPLNMHVLLWIGRKNSFRDVCEPQALLLHAKYLTGKKMLVRNSSTACGMLLEGIYAALGEIRHLPAEDLLWWSLQTAGRSCLLATAL